MTDLRVAVTDYLALRRALGFKLDRAEGLLGGFVDHLEVSGATHITIEAALEWATAPGQASAWWWRQRLGIVRGFARHVQAIDPMTEVPPPGLIPSVVPRATPYMYSDGDIAALMEAAGRLGAPRAHTYRCLLGMLAVTGMRVSEAIGLDDADVDLDSRVVVVRHAKFGKTRELALHASTTNALADYRAFRSRPHPIAESTAFFVSTRGTRLHYSNVLAVFQRLIDEADLGERRNGRRPRMHDLRHRFAVQAVLDWHAAGLDVGPRLAALSTYLGHTKPADTYWYLSATPELLGLAALRLEDLDRDDDRPQR